MRRPFTTDPGRLEAFSDGVLAVIITIMVLELKPPHGVDFAALHDVWPTLAAYALSFIFIGIYWNNHHHMLRAARSIDGRSMWLNLHLLFWLSLVPFLTQWVGENPTAPLPTAMYGVVLMCAAIAYFMLQNALIAINGSDTAFAQAIRVDVKGKLSTLIYVFAIGLAFVRPWIADALFVVVTIMWFIPDRRMEQAIAANATSEESRRLS